MKNAARRFVLVVLAADLLIALAPHSSANDPPAAAPASEPAVEQVDETFPSHGKHVAVERFAPRAPGRHPLVVLLHGAGGIGPDGPGSPLHQEARLLAQRGYVVMIPHYFDRTAGPKRSSPTQNARYYKVWIQTVSDLVTYAGRLPQVDSSRVGLLGHSLGGSLVHSCAMADSRVSAVVSYAGSLVLVYGLPPEPLPMPPTLLFHGDADTVVPVREARKLEALFNEWQTPVELKIYPGAGHGFHGADAADAWNRATQFLDRHLKGTR
jgi:carboxymethylenebutenolidase